MIFPKLELFDHFAIDTEGNGLKWWLPEINTFGFSISTPDGKDYYWDIRDKPKAIDWLVDSCKEYNGRIIGHNMKFDTHFLKKAGADLTNNKLDCTSVRACLIDENRMTYNLADLARDCIGVKKVDPYQELADLFGGKATRKAQILNLGRPEARQITDRYAKGDTRATLLLWEWQREQIENEDLHRIIDLERRVFKVVYDMEKRGIKVDVDTAQKSVIKLDGIIEDKRKDLDRLAGFPINPNPSGSIKKLFNPKQGKDGVWVAVDGTRLQSTKAGKPSINADALRAMTHPAAEKILTVRKLIKCRDTFILGHVLGSQHNGRVYPNINQTKGEDGGTKTGRLSYTGPALQQIPSRDKMVKSLTRVLFLSESGQKWYKMDYSQADARGFVHYVQSPPLVKAYKENPRTDFHNLTASLTGLPRNAPFAGGANAKQMGLGLLFSMGEGTMAQEMGLPYTVKSGHGDREWLAPGPEAEAVFKNFHAAVPGVKEFSKRAISVAKTRGFIMSLMGRHMRFPRGMFAYKAAGYLYQSATAEFNKVKMVDTHELLRGTDSELLLSVHDELNFSSDDPDLMKRARIEMEDFSSEKAMIKLKVPMVVDPEVGDNWYNVKKLA